jgi:hypothetical protein
MPQSDPTEELVRIERRRKAVVRQRRRSRFRTLVAVLAVGGAGVGGFYVGKAYSTAPGAQLKTSDRGLQQVTLTDTVAVRTVTVVTRRTP